MPAAADTVPAPIQTLPTPAPIESQPIQTMPDPQPVVTQPVVTHLAETMPIDVPLPVVDEHLGWYPEDDVEEEPKRRPPVGLLVALFAAVVVGIAAFFVLSGDSAPSDADSLTESSVVSNESDAGGAIAQTLDDANDTVDAVNDNSQESELLAELGLDATGNPVVVVGAEAGYRFNWNDPSGQDLDIVVDAVADNYSVTASDGISFRFLAGEYFGKAGVDGEWYMLADDPFGSIPVVGLDGIPSEAEIVPPSANAYIVSDEIDGPTRTVTIDDAAFAAADLSGRNAWLGPWGLIDDAGEVASTVVVRLTFDPTGQNVVGAHIETPAIGGFAAFSITETYEVAPVIDNPMSALPGDEVAVDLGE